MIGANSEEFESSINSYYGNEKEKLWEERKRCPRCGSINLRLKTRNVYVKTLKRRVELLECKDCSHRFRSIVIKKHNQLPRNLMQKYLKVRSLSSLKSSLRLDADEKTIHRWLVRELNTYPTWEDLFPYSCKKQKFSHIMGLDMTTLKIKKQRFYYLHVLDFPQNHLAYEILENKDAENIEAVLMKLKSMGYTPIIIITDLAKELLQAIRNVFPNAMIQGCLLHLRMWLNKKFPTKTLKPIRQDMISIWNNVKSAIMKVAYAKSVEERKNYIEELKSLTKSDSRVKYTVNRFLANLKYYHVLNELMLLGCKPEWRYNNACERAMRTVKELGRKMYGFKTVEHARKYINAMWAIKRENKSPEPNAEKPRSIQETLMPLFGKDYLIDLGEAAKVLGMNMDKLKMQAEYEGLIVKGNLAFERNFFETIRETVFKEQPKTLDEFLRATGGDSTVAFAIAKALGIRLLWKDLRDVLLIYPCESHG